MPRGPKPTPTPVKILKGSYAKNPQRFNGNEPDAPPGWPPPPDIDPAALEIWKTVCTNLESMGILSPCYFSAIERYAVFIWRWRLAKDALDDGKMIKIGTECNKLEAVFGFNPADKGRIIGSKPTIKGLPQRKRKQG